MVTNEQGKLQVFQVNHLVPKPATDGSNEPDRDF